MAAVSKRVRTSGGTKQSTPKASRTGAHDDLMPQVPAAPAVEEGSAAAPAGASPTGPPRAPRASGGLFSPSALADFVVRTEFIALSDSEKMTEIYKQQRLACGRDLAMMRCVYIAVSDTRVPQPTPRSAVSVLCHSEPTGNACTLPTPTPAVFTENWSLFVGMSQPWMQTPRRSCSVAIVAPAQRPTRCWCS